MNHNTYAGISFEDENDVYKSIKLKEYIFHYNGDESKYGLYEPDGSWTYHHSLLTVDGTRCKTDISTARLRDGKRLVEAYFEDGNELNVWIDELEEV